VSMTRKGRHPLEFRQMAVERMKGCENIVALSEELGVPGGCCIAGAINLIESRIDESHRRVRANPRFVRRTTN
jgi:hypothetical protein